MLCCDCCVTVCSDLISLPPYSKIDSSTERHKADSSSCGTQYGYIITDKGWCPRRSNGLYAFLVVTISLILLLIIITCNTRTLPNALPFTPKPLPHDIIPTSTRGPTDDITNQTQ